ncbi:putative Reverse transcriptase [Seiridium cardinale]
MFMSRCLSNAETRYGPSELEVACLVWSSKKLRTLVQSANLPVVMLTDHSATKGIVDQTSLNTYGYQVHHLAGKMNILPDALSRLKQVQDVYKNSELQRTDEIPILDDVWFTSAEAVIDPELRKRFIEAYPKDRKFWRTIKDLQQQESDFDKIKALRPHIRKDAQLAMDFAAAKAKRLYDEKHRAIKFAVGDYVYLRLHSGYHLPSKPPRKFSQQRSGPFPIKRRVGKLAYELDLPNNTPIYPVISIAHLSPTPDGKDPFHRRAPPPGPVQSEQGKPEDIYETEIIINHRPNKRRRNFDYLVKWKGYGHEDN